jgi:hypothetical protein
MRHALVVLLGLRTNVPLPATLWDARQWKAARAGRGATGS